MQDGTHTFAITRSKWVRPLLWVMGATAGRSYVTVDGQRLHARFGYYSLDVPLDHVTAAERSSWSLWSGIGIRTNLSNSIALVGSTDNVVRLRVQPPLRATVLKIPIQMTELYLSIDEPNRFLQVVQATIGTGDGTERS